MPPSDPHGSPIPQAAPRHPVPQLQAPFEESMVESAYDDSDPDMFYDPVTRRNMLLEAPTYTRVVAGRWKQKHGERFHPLWKLIAQISFGVHLLAEGMAKSEDDVMQILQAHVDEIDGFLERTTEDFDLASDDIQERLRCLKLPLSHPATFDKMLEDRNFRLSIVEGNEKIEHVVERTSQSMKDCLKDVQKGFEATSCLETYLQGLSASWQRQSLEHEAVFVAMLGNVEGWRKAFLSLHNQGTKLGGALKKLTDIINEMQARAGEVSRRLLHQARVQHPQMMGRPTGRNTPSTGRNTPTSRFQSAPTKQLPGMPDRPPLRQAASNEGVQTSAGLRTSSQDALRQQAILNRSQTPPQDMPARKQLNTANSPRIIQIGSNSQARVQSMVPSLLGSTTPPITTPPMVSADIEETEEPRERYFPPVELPAHVPEETMRQAPMSKQNRFSVGLGLTHGKLKDRTEKRNSRLGTSALVDLLRTNVTGSKTTDTPPSRSPDAGRRASPTITSITHDTSLGSTAAPSTTSSKSTTSTHANNPYNKANIRRPKKGAQHWFDAIEDDSEEEEKISVQGEPVIQTTTITLSRPDMPAPNHPTEPGTPAWAVKTFAQAEKRKELLKKGAFSSHPPELPPGSPPVNEEATFPQPATLTTVQRRPSHASSAGQSTLGEPGPEVPAFETSNSVAAPVIRSSARTFEPNRASSFAPEVLVVDKMPPLPVTKKQFVAEMEGSPVIPGAPSHKQYALELEAPRRHFILPPRPQSVQPPSVSSTTESVKVVVEAVRPTESALPPVSEGTKAENISITVESEAEGRSLNAAKNENLDTGLSIPGGNMDLTKSTDKEHVTEPKTELPTKAPSPSPVAEQAQDTARPADEPQVVEQFALQSHDRDNATLPTSIFVPTPRIPLPPSPYEDEVDTETEIPAKAPSHVEPLYMLPSLAYKPPPISPRLPPDPIIARPAAQAKRPKVDEATGTPEVEGSSTSDPDSAERQANKRPATESRPEAEAGVEAPRKQLPVSPPSQQDEYDPFRPADDEKVPKSIAEYKPKPKVTPISTAASGASMVRNNKPAALKHTRKTSNDSQNGWKAFFTGQPSPVGSTLSIRSIKRESAIEQSPRSPAMLSPASASSRHPFPPSPVAGNAKETVWYNKSLTDVKPEAKSASQTSVQAKDGAGLGITTSNGSNSTTQKTVDAVQ